MVVDLHPHASKRNRATYTRSVHATRVCSASLSSCAYANGLVVDGDDGGLRIVLAELEQLAHRVVVECRDGREERRTTNGAGVDVAGLGSLRVEVEHVEWCMARDNDRATTTLERELEEVLVLCEEPSNRIVRWMRHGENTSCARKCVHVCVTGSIIIDDDAAGATVTTRARELNHR